MTKTAQHMCYYNITGTTSDKQQHGADAVEFFNKE